MARVLLTTEVGSEGLDFQFCDTIFNYDLPWNPMRVEQRIGRIDRYGQTREQVRIYSFFLADTIEERILERLYTRIRIFEESVGDLEPILGPIANELTKEVFRSALSPEQEAQMAERFARMIIERRAEEAALETSSSKLLGQDALLLQAIEENIRSGRYVSPAELRAVVDGFLHERFQLELIDRVGDGTVLVPADSRLRTAISDYLQRQRDSRPVGTGFLRKFGQSSRIAATFTGEKAHQAPLLELLNLGHPLVRLAVEHQRQKPRPSTYPVVRLRCDAIGGEGLSEGSFRFMLFVVELRGAVQQVRLIPIAYDVLNRRVEGLEDQLLRLLQELAEDEPDGRLTESDRDELELMGRRAMAGVADQLEAEAIERSEATLAVRRATLERTYSHRLRRRRIQLENAKDVRLRRMFTSAVANLEAEFASRLEDLESNRAVSVTVKPIGAGTLTIAPPVPAAEPAVVREDVEQPVARATDPYREPPPRKMSWD